MPSPLKSRLVQHDSGLWEASAIVEGQEVHFGYFAEKGEAQRTLDAALASFGGEGAETEGA